jgi:alanine dehydrogenase
MKIGVLKEIKFGESRVILTPAEVKALVLNNHQVFVEQAAGTLAGFNNEAYEQAGATILKEAKEIYNKCDLVAKVKEIEPEEFDLLKEEQIIFTCLHPASDRDEVDMLLKKKIIGFTAEDSHRYGSPNCEVAGKLGALMGINHLQSHHHGNGKLVGGIGGAPGIKAMVIGAGIVGQAATDVLVSLGADVSLLDINIQTLREVNQLFNNKIQTLYSHKYNIDELLPTVDLVMNCVKWPKTREDYLIARKDLKMMQDKSVLVDVSADFDGAIESFKPTTHEDPTFVEEGVVHYCVDNIPGAVPHTASKAYAASVFPHILNIANNGVRIACLKDGYLRRSLTTYKGTLTHGETSIVQNRPYTTPEKVLEFKASEDYEVVPPAVNLDSL